MGHGMPMDKGYQFKGWDFFDDLNLFLNCGLRISVVEKIEEIVKIKKKSSDNTIEPL